MFLDFIFVFMLYILCNMLVRVLGLCIGNGEPQTILVFLLSVFCLSHDIATNASLGNTEVK